MSHIKLVKGMVYHYRGTYIDYHKAYIRAHQLKGNNKRFKYYIAPTNRGYNLWIRY